jgi:hypothetical protein
MNEASTKRLEEITLAHIRIPQIAEEIGKVQSEPPIITKIIDWGTNRGQGKRSGNMVKGSMACIDLRGKKSYEAIDMSKYWREDLKSDFRILASGLPRLSFLYWKAREFGTTHLEAMVYAFAYE